MSDKDDDLEKYIAEVEKDNVDKTMYTQRSYGREAAVAVTSGPGKSEAKRRETETKIGAAKDNEDVILGKDPPDARRVKNARSNAIAQKLLNDGIAKNRRDS
jgi:cell division septum initiation protein DivIVA